MGKEIRKCGSSWEYCDGKCTICTVNTKIVASGSTEGTYGNVNETFVMKGWACPICGRANAPWVSHCDCIAPVMGATNFGCIHEWESVSSDIYGNIYQCKKCGIINRVPYNNT